MATSAVSWRALRDGRGEKEGRRGSGGVGGWAAANVAKWPKFQPKSSKGAGEKKVSWKNLWPYFAEKGPKKFFENISFLAALFSCTGQKIVWRPGNTGTHGTS